MFNGSMRVDVRRLALSVGVWLCALRVVHATMAAAVYDNGTAAAQIRSRLLANLNRYSIGKWQGGDGLLEPIADLPANKTPGRRTGKTLFREGPASTQYKVNKLHASNIIMPPLTSRPKYVNRSAARYLNRVKSPAILRNGAPTIADGTLLAAVSSVDVRPMVLRKLTSADSAAVTPHAPSLVVREKNRILLKRRLVEVLPSLAHNHDVDNDILPSTQPNAATQFGGVGAAAGYVRDQHEYARTPALLFASSQLQQSPTFLGQQLEPFGRPPVVRGTASQIPPPFEPIRLLSEFATTTAIAVPAALQTFAPSVYARETAALDDEYYEDELMAAAYDRQGLQNQNVPGLQSPPTPAVRGSQRIEENTQMCNSQRLANVIRKATIAGNAEATKRAIQRRAEDEFRVYYNVVCGTGYFSYIAHTSEFCLAPATGDLNCYIFAPTAPHIGRRRRRWHA